MFQVATSTKEEVDSLSVNINVAEQGDDIVILNEKDHTYYNLATGEIYESVTTAIKGKMPKSKQVENQINLDIGNDVDALLDALVSFESFESAIPNMQVLNAEQAEEVYKRLKDELSQIIPKSTVLISQVVVFDPATKIAGTADLIAIDENGNIKIIDLKTSKNSIYKKTVKDSFVSGIPGRSEVFQYETKEWDILPSTEDVIEDLEDNNVKKEDGNKYSKEQIKNRKEELAPTLYKKAGVTKLSTRGQHNLQVNMYKRMFENMGYKVLGNENGAATFHMLADISGKGKDQVFNGGIKYDGLYQHKATEEQDKVEEQVKLVLKERRRLEKAFSSIPFIEECYPSDANFLLVRLDDSSHRYQQLLENGIVVRNPSKNLNCENTLRISVGLPEENNHLIEVLSNLS